MVIRRYAQANPLGPDAYYANRDAAPHQLTIEQYHSQHPLILTNDVSTSTKSLACDLCTQPIIINNPSPPLFRYSCDDCHFVAHKVCADTLTNAANFFIPFYGVLAETDPYPGQRFFFSVFYCRICHRPCNRLCSFFPRLSQIFQDGLPLCVDLECMAAPITVSHASHPAHLLFRTDYQQSVRAPLTCCNVGTSIYDVYRCIVCDYFIHIRCDLLPKRIHFREYHRPHLLHLTYNNNHTTAATAAVDEGEDFCEVCEESIDLKYWLYRCVECDQSYHINCIPSVGYLSKVKFGRKLSLPPSVHDHPLTLKRMLTLPSQRCGDCRKIIRGMVDEMSFFCSLCYFWLHFSCARNSATAHASDHLLLYSDYNGS